MQTVEPVRRKAMREAVRELRDYDHCFISQEGADHFAERFGVKLSTHVARANPDDPKGLTLEDGATEAVGIDAADMAESICKSLGVGYVPKMGRGSRLRSCCDALEAALKD